MNKKNKINHSKNIRRIVAEIEKFRRLTEEWTQKALKIPSSIYENIPTKPNILSPELKKCNFKLWIEFISDTYWPKDVKKFINNKVTFILLNPGIAGTCAYVKGKLKRYVIVIYKNDAYGDSKHGNNIAFVLSHEVAHAWLGHPKYEFFKTKFEYDELEDEANSLVSEWGVPSFRGDDVEYYKKIHGIKSR